MKFSYTIERVDADWDQITFHEFPDEWRGKIDLRIVKSITCPYWCGILYLPGEYREHDHEPVLVPHCRMGEVQTALEALPNTPEVRYGRFEREVE